MRIASVGQAVFATTMIGLGIVGLLYSDLVPVWNPVPASLPAHQLLIYLSSVISLITGIGLLLKRTAALAASVLLVTLLLWLLLFRLPNFFHAPLFVGSSPESVISIPAVAAISHSSGRWPQ